MQVKDANTAIAKANSKEALNGRVVWCNKESAKGRIRGDDETEYFVTLNAVAAGRSESVTFSDQVDMKTYQTRVISSANKMNLEFDEAAPVLKNGLTRALSGMF